MKRSVPAIAVLLLWASATVQAEPAPGIAGETAPLRQPPPGGKILPHQWTVDGEPLPQPPPSTAGQIAKIDVKRLIDYGPDRGTAMSRAAEGNLGPDGKTIAKFEIHAYDAEGREITPIDWKKANAILNYGIDSEPIPPGSDKAVLVSANAGLFDVENGKVILKLVTVEGVTGDAIVRVFLKNNPAIVGKAKATVGVLMGPPGKVTQKQPPPRSGLRHLSDAISEHPSIAAGTVIGAGVVAGAVVLAGGGSGGGGNGGGGGGFAYAGHLSGSFGGTYTSPVIGQGPGSGSLDITISKNGSVSGSYAGIVSGSVSGSVSANGHISFGGAGTTFSGALSRSGNTISGGGSCGGSYQGGTTGQGSWTASGPAS